MGFLCRFSVIFAIFLVFILHHNVCYGAEDNTEGEDKTANDGKAEEKEQTEISPEEIYRQLLKQKRKEHRKAVTKISKMEKYEKQYELVKQTLEKMHKVMSESRVKLTESGYMPGDPMPTEEKMRDAFSIVVENTGFFSDILLKLPDMTHKILKKKKEWDMVFRWGIGFCNDTNVLDTKDTRVFHLAAQEIGLIEKGPDYINPYRKRDPSKDGDKKKAVQDIEKVIAEKMAEFNKKMAKQGKGGPKLSRMEHTEL